MGRFWCAAGYGKGRPYGNACRGGRACPPGPDNATPCRAGPVCPAGERWAGDRKGRPYGGLQEVRWGEESPSHGFAVPAPFGQGGQGDGLPQPVTSVTGFAMTHCKECGRAGRCGERTERCQWQRKRSERVAAVKILSVRRKAAQKFWAPQQDHRPLRGVYR